MTCRHCGAEAALPFIDLGTAPPSNAYLRADQLASPEIWHPLRVLTCTRCWLVQTEHGADRDMLFTEDYAYFSSFSASWLRHAERYVESVVERFGLGPRSRVVEIASNDGYLLQFVKARGIPCLGVEPTASTAGAARRKGIDVVEEFFGCDLARVLVAQGGGADLVVANNVLAHVPSIDDFAAGVACLLKPDGVATFEFPHLLRLIQQTQFDTIYHEHFSYLSLTVAACILGRQGLSVFDVEVVPTHGGSLRVYAQRSGSGVRPESAAVAAVLEEERQEGVCAPGLYAGFQAQAERVKNEFVGFLLDAADAGKTVAGYGAAAKGSTLLNFSGVRADLIRFVADRNPAKQGRYMPGSRIPIVDPSTLEAERPDYVVIFPWNLSSEIREQLAGVNRWGGAFVTAVPRLEIAR